MTVFFKQEALYDVSLMGFISLVPFWINEQEKWQQDNGCDKTTKNLFWEKNKTIIYEFNRVKSYFLFSRSLTKQKLKLIIHILSAIRMENNQSLYKNKYFLNFIM